MRTFLVHNVASKFRPSSFAYIGTIGISIICGSFIFRGRTLIDEVLYIVISIYCFKYLIQNKLFQISKFSHSKLELISLSYLLISTTCSYVKSPNSSSLRFILLYITFFIFTIFFCQVEQNLLRFREISSILFSLYLYIWLIYWILLTIMDVDWQLEQARSFAGSTYAALIAMVGIFLTSTEVIHNKNIFFRKLFWFNFSLTLLASQIYDSRALFLSILILAVLLLVLKLNLRTFFNLILFFGLSVVISNTFTVIGLDNKSDALPWYVSQVYNVQNNTNLINSPRESDQDRSHSIKCSTKIVFQESSKLKLFFGYGQNNHKTKLVQCWPEIERTIVRPIGYAAYIIDFGAIGLILMLLLFLKRSFEIIILKAREGILILVALQLSMLWSLITNYLDHSLIYLILFSSFLKFFLKDLKKGNEIIR